MMYKLPKYQRIRLPIQLIFLFASVLFTTLIVMGLNKAVHAICPYAIVCFGISKAGIVTATHVSFALTIIISLGIIISSMFIGRKFCSYVCPLGTVQEAVFSLHPPSYYKRNRLSYFYESKLSRIKYLVLLITSVLSLLGIGYLFIRICPIYALSMLPFLAIPGLVMLLFVVVSSYFADRFWCRFLCPFAALMNVAQYVGKLFGLKRLLIRRNLERCIDCGICMQHCPMNINIAESEYVHSPDCIHCMKCADKCPKPGTICCEKDE